MTPAPPDDDGLPATWSESARTTYREIVDEHGDRLGASELATLYECASLLAAADAMQSRIDADGLVVAGSADQPVAHPLISEVRQARVQALAALRAIGLGREQSAASIAGATLAGKRHHGRTAGVRGGK